MSEDQSEPERLLWRQCQAIADMKFTYVVSCQQYGIHKRSGDPRAQDILKLMTTYVHVYYFILSLLQLFLLLSSLLCLIFFFFCSYPALRVAYIDEIEEPNKDNKKEKVYYSSLVKAAISKAGSSDGVVQPLDQVMHC